MTNSLYPSHSAKLASGDEALASLVRTIRLNESTIEIGAGICEQLNHQGQQIKGVMDSLAEIDKKVDICEVEVGKMNSITGLGFWHAIRKFFSRTPKVKDTIPKILSAKPKKNFFFKKKEDSTSKKAKSEQKQQQLALQPKRSVENQIDAALNIVDGQIKIIKGMTVQINTELSSHNEILDITNKASSIARKNINHVANEERRML
jgi:hypothetical protein